MAGHAVEHDYHLIEPSPWPFLSGIAALIWGAGMVIFFAGLQPRTGESPMMEWFFSKGLDSLQDSYRASADKVGADGGWFFLLLGSLFAAYVATSMAPGVKGVDPWNLPLMNTVILLLSGTTVTWAHHALIHGDRRGAKWGLGLTVVLGLLFTFVQGYEYLELFHYHGEGHHPWISADAFGSAFFMATGFHGLHVLIGTIFLAIMYLRLMKGGLRPEKHFGLEAAAWYWHFVDVVWLFLFAFVYIIFAVGM